MILFSRTGYDAHGRARPPVKRLHANCASVGFPRQGQHRRLSGGRRRRYRWGDGCGVHWLVCSEELGGKHSGLGMPAMAAAVPNSV